MSKNSDIFTSPPPFYPSSSSSKISPTLILILVILAVIFFVSGILHLLIRFLVKRPLFHTSFSQPSRISDSSNRNNSNSDVIQRQLQQLFRLHDSGLDQPLIDALPVFYYKDIMGLKEPFDCAVCLCKFNDEDKLRLLPLCSHAFHISCIDTWLLSNSTCPLCRGSLLSHGLENQEFSLDYWRELSFGRSICSDYDHTNNGHSFNCGSSYKPTIMEENASERRVFSVRLGKFKSLNDGSELSKNRENSDCDHVKNGHSFNYSHKPTIMEEDASERRVFSVRLGKFKCLNDGNELCKERENSIIASTSCQLDARRCYSLGSYQYVLDDSDFQVALSAEIGASGGDIGDVMLEKTTGNNGNVFVDGDVEGKKISGRNRGDSFSVSKIWLWSKKDKLQGSSNTINNNGATLPINAVLPLSTRDVDVDKS